MLPALVTMSTTSSDTGMGVTKFALRLRAPGPTFPGMSDQLVAFAVLIISSVSKLGA